MPPSKYLQAKEHKIIFKTRA